MAGRLTFSILGAMLLGILAGLALHETAADPTMLKGWADHLTIVTDLFLRLVKMIVAPLVFATLVAGVAHMGDTAALGRIAARTLGWFVAASFVSLLLGLLLVNLLAPGAHTALPLPPAGQDAGIATKGFDLHEFVTHIVPASIVQAMAENEILPIVVFSLFFGVALAAVGEAGRPLARGIDALSAAMLKVTDYVMRAAPLAVFAAIAHAVAINGAGILLAFGKFVGGFYLTLAILWTVLAGAGLLFVGPRMGELLRLVRAPALLAFSTASSEAAFPRLLENLEKFGVPRRIAGFVLPLGYSFNLDGSMIYMTFASLFVAQAYGIELSVGQQVAMLLILMVTSKGMAGVPRASLVVIAAVMGRFGIPEAGLLLILAVDQFLDMGRSATNVLGNAVATAVIARWEGELPPRKPATVHDAGAVSR